MKYTIKEVGKRFGDNKDWFSVTFEELESAQGDNDEVLGYNVPTLMNTLEEFKPGDTVEGVISTTSKGKPLFIFKRPFVLDRHQSLIMSQWAMRLGYEHATDHTNMDEVMAIAEMAFKGALELSKQFSDE